MGQTRQNVLDSQVGRQSFAQEAEKGGLLVGCGSPDGGVFLRAYAPFFLESHFRCRCRSFPQVPFRLVLVTIPEVRKRIIRNHVRIIPGRLIAASPPPGVLKICLLNSFAGSWGNGSRGRGGRRKSHGRGHGERRIAGRTGQRDRNPHEAAAMRQFKVEATANL